MNSFVEMQHASLYILLRHQLISSDILFIICINRYDLTTCKSLHKYVKKNKRSQCAAGVFLWFKPSERPKLWGISFPNRGMCWMDQSLKVTGNERCMCLCAVPCVLCHRQASHWQVISCSHIICFICDNVPDDEMSA